MSVYLINVIFNYSFFVERELRATIRIKREEKRKPFVFKHAYVFKIESVF